MDLVVDARPLDLLAGAREPRLARWRRAAELVRIAHESAGHPVELTEFAGGHTISAADAQAVWTSLGAQRAP